ncbi:MAG: hypothetical protein HC880_16125 [Bacteroidia bacterium]|nr:hypothetical protein [Bacteroidia bacterium]
MKNKTKTLICVFFLLLNLSIKGQDIDLESVLFSKFEQEYLRGSIPELDKTSEQLLHLMLAKSKNYDLRKIFLSQNNSLFLSGVILDDLTKEEPDSILFIIDKTNENLYIFLFPSVSGFYKRNYLVEDILGVFVFDSYLMPKFSISYINEYAKRVDYYQNTNGVYRTNHKYFDKSDEKKNLSILNLPSLTKDLMDEEDQMYSWEKTNVCLNGVLSVFLFECP